MSDLPKKILLHENFKSKILANYHITIAFFYIANLHREMPL